MSEEIQTGIIVRMAGPDDAASIASVLYESFAEYESSYTPEAFAATVCTPALILDRLREGPIWVAVLDGMVVGTVSVVPKGAGLYVRGMAVSPRARGKGVGGLLLERAEQYALGCGLRRMFLSTTPFLADAIRLYEHHGFLRTGEGPHDLLGTPLFTMEKGLQYNK